ncbi:hypothetical protein OOZ63_17225 [Paucibacter sp. PLA-PC-4]|nr:hypothetical protein [Paucibacter sp. PLA-PC-4]MCX2863575.1 hypothetical protein [Paucibacter sp. PLA-PC-4]
MQRLVMRLLHSGVAARGVRQTDEILKLASANFAEADLDHSEK